MIPGDNEILRPAENLDEVYWTLQPSPLITKPQLEAFYREELNEVRGEDVVDRLARRLDQSLGRSPYKAFLVGQPGSGKSTEISRLAGRIEARYRTLRLSAAQEVNPTTFQPFDILLLILFRLADAMKDVFDEHPRRETIPEPLLEDVLRFFGDESKSTMSSQERDLHAEASAGAGFPKLWASFLSFRAEAGSKIKVGYQQETHLVQYRFATLGALTDLTNRFVAECDRLLERLEQRRWLIVVEDFDRYGMAAEQLRRVLIEYGGLFRQLNISLLFTIPAWLGYSQEAEKLPFERDHLFLITDTPVYLRTHEPDERGRASLRAVMDARVKRDLFEGRSLEMLIVASGGNLRDLFAMARDSSDRAVLRKSGKIAEQDARKAILKTLQEYRNRLGSSTEEPNALAYEGLKTKLLQVYKDEAASRVPDATLYALLRSRAALHFDGDGWFGVHPLVVDVLRDQGALPADAPGGTI